MDEDLKQIRASLELFKLDTSPLDRVEAIIKTLREEFPKVLKRMGTTVCVHQTPTDEKCPLCPDSKGEAK